MKDFNVETAIKLKKAIDAYLRQSQILDDVDHMLELVENSEINPSAYITIDTYDLELEKRDIPQITALLEERRCHILPEMYMCKRAIHDIIFPEKDET